MEKRLRMFFAIPFDPETMSMYKKYIIPRLEKNYGKQSKLECVIGNKVIGVPEPYGAIETFKMQNAELFDHFVKSIRDADIVVADLTGNNPNVHVELGIALFYNKNILRVTRGPYEHLAFDIRDYEVIQWKVKEDLFDTIKKNLDLFFQIKALDFKAENSRLYYYSPDKETLECWKDNKEKQRIIAHIKSKPGLYTLSQKNTDFQMRDGKVRVTFNIVDQIDQNDWFGINLRTDGKGFSHGSVLVYVRKKGILEIATYPGAKIRKSLQLSEPYSGDKTLKVELEGDRIRADLDNNMLDYSGLDIQSTGFVIFASLNSNSQFWNAQIVCRDTIETYDSFS